MIRGKERREAKRISYICEVECAGAGISRLATRITDLSTTGAFIDSMTNYAPGTRLLLKFRVKDLFVETACEVRYTMARMGMGVRFIDLRPESLAVLEYLIDGKPLDAPPPAPEPRPVPGGNVRNMLTGNFAIVSLLDVIQLIENNRLTGALVILSPAAAGEAHFHEGRIVGASCGEAAGREALVNFLDVTEGTFTFNKTEVAYPRTIQASSNTHLMLDLLRNRGAEVVLSCLSDP